MKHDARLYDIEMEMNDLNRLPVIQYYCKYAGSWIFFYSVYSYKKLAWWVGTGQSTSISSFRWNPIYDLQKIKKTNTYGLPAAERCAIHGNDAASTVSRFYLGHQEFCRIGDPVRAHIYIYIRPLGKGMEGRQSSKNQGGQHLLVGSMILPLK
ncbi:hypothetical protein H6P81_000563 [Aristolochia fimbriata]|uniref:Uncharacterized protein n=1 Tax=Aristolochia fimbriata TaxID=158543 RepID=A0AAV7F715_ARIFI|nr:hypothetical protein H6P81_000563 [Aristolochia fimbriata]